jgi:glycine/D-amino acid oxidase-like deaminating enzyme
LATRKRQLRNGRSLWFAYPAPRIKTVQAKSEMTADVLIVGAGISGALIGELLSSRGHSVILVDRRGPILGSTPASTALVLYEIDMPIIKLRNKIGVEKAIRAWRRSKLALENLRHRTEYLGIKCDLEQCDSLYLAGDMLGERGVVREGEARRCAGFESVLLDRAQLRRSYGIQRPAALLSFGSLTLDPRRLTAGYLQAAITKGAKVIARDEVTALSESGSGVKVITRSGGMIAARVAIYASGYELPHVVRDKSLRIASTFVLATRPQKRNLWPGEAVIWEASDPYLYLRTTPDGRIICGGEDEDFADEEKRNAMLAAKISRLRAKLGRLFPGVDTTAEFAWSANFGTSATGLPRIGRVPGHKHVYAALGYGGNGITYSRLAAELLSAELDRKRDPDADLFTFRA